MSAEPPRLWLPAVALDCVRVRAAAGEAVDAWSRAWFAGTHAVAARFEASAGQAPDRAAPWRLHGAGIALAASGADAVRLAGLALGADIERLVLSEADRDIVGRLSATVTADLARRLEAAFGLAPAETGEPSAVEDPFAGAGGIMFTATDGEGRPLLHAALSGAAIVPFVKGAIQMSKRRRPALARLSRAIGATGIRVEARLGSAALGLGELATLAVGDVLILDRTLDDGVALVLAPTARPFARGDLDPQSETLSLTLSNQERGS
jgi:hypothetical protein